MNFLIVCVVFSCLVLLPQNSESLLRRGKPRVQKSTLGIYDGKTTTPEKYPYVVAILDESSFICAGTIVSEQWIITIADCLIHSQVSDLKVVAGSNDTVTGTVYDVVQVVNHTDYDSSTYDYNYALVEVSGTFSWSSVTQAVALPSSKLCSFTSVTVVGYGQTESSSTSSAQLREGSMKWWSRLMCKSFYNTEDITLTDRIACAYNVGKTTLCTGDIANPFVLDGVLYGMFFFSPTMGFCASWASPVLVADVYPVADWISNVTGATYDNLQ